MKTTIIILLLFWIFSVNLFGQSNKFFQKKKEEKKENTEKNEFLFNQHFFSGIKEKNTENYEEALYFFEKSTKIKSNIAAPFYELSIIYKQRGEFSLASQNIKRALAINPKNRWYMITYAEILFLENDFENSAVQYKKLIELEEGNEELYFMLADVYIYDKKFKKAIEVYDDLEKYKGVEKAISMQKHKLYMQLKQKNKAIKELHSILNVFPEELQVLELLSELYLLNNQKQKAFDIFKKIAAISPENGRVHLTLANYYREQGKNEESFLELKTAFKSPKVNIDTKIRILVSYFQFIGNDSEMTKQAHELSKILIDTHNKQPKAHAIYGDVLYAEGRFKEAKEEYLIVLEQDKTKLEVWRQVLFIQAEESQFKEMIVTSRKALEYFPAEPLFYYFNGISNKLEKNYLLAVKSLETGLEFVFDNNKLLVEYYSSLGDCYHSLKEHVISDSFYEKALHLDSNNIIVLNNYAYYLALRKEKLSRAQKMSLQSNNIEPNNATYQDTYAWVLYQKAEYKEAEKWILEAIKNKGNESATILEHYGDILYRLGKKKEAVIQWENAKKIGEGSKFLKKKIEDKKLYE